MPATATAPSVSEAFSLDMYFNSATTDSLEPPVPKNGLTVPSPWGTVVPASSNPTGNPQGYRAWRREWRVWNPGGGGVSPYWSPGLRKLVVGATNPVNSNCFSAKGQVFTINLWDLNLADLSTPAPQSTSASTATNTYIQVAAYYLDANNQP